MPVTCASAGPSGELQRYDAFLEFRYGGHLGNYRTFAGKYSFAFGMLSVSAIASGLLSSGIAAGWSNADWARWTILILGLIAGISAAMNQLWRPGQKAASRMRGANALTSEGWAYLNSRGVYQGKSARDAREPWQTATPTSRTPTTTAAQPGN